MLLRAAFKNKGKQRIISDITSKGGQYAPFAQVFNLCGKTDVIFFISSFLFVTKNSTFAV